MARCRSMGAGLTASMLEPAIAALLATRLLQERLSQGERLGCLLMALAILVLMRTEAAPQYDDEATGKAPAIG
jgi:drug/metabolite transporter (DMT)-like permease